MHPIRLVSSLAALAVCCFTSIVDAQQTTGQAPGNAQANTARPGPVRALLITGGCCHDYDRQKLIIPKGVSARADVVWTVVQQGGTVTDSKIPLYEDPNWADGFDVIVHNECFADVKDQAWVERILKPHREGKPAVLIHCAMHCYRTGNDSWFEFCGVQSPGHGPHYAYTVTNQSPNHPIMKDFGPQWSVPKGELYDTIKLFPTATPLATAPRQSDNQPQTCIWTNNYHGTRVFATTIGHYNETMAQPQYLDFLTRGILWAVHGDQAPELKSVSEEQNQQVMALVSADTKANTAVPESRCCQEGNLAYQQATSASSEETGKENFAKKAVDGDLSTRWCASGGSPGEWLQIDLASEQAIGGIRLHWEQPNNAYKYRIEGSTDAQSWQVLVDQSENKKNRRVVSHETDPAKTKARYIKITYLGSKSGGWGSLFEVEVAKDKLPELPAGSDALKAEVATLADVKAPAGFEVRMFAAPPQVSYPVCLTAAATGEVFVGIDEQGSLGKEKGRGQIVRCFDRDGDGVADEVNTFAKIDHPRGLVYDQGSLWVLHPPYLTLLKDNDLDGVADEQRVLIDGISTDQVAARGADHTTNGIRMGIDGWIYIAVGDYGFLNAKGTDGRVMSRRGGGIVRVRPDGAEMEVYSWGQRNILDACIDPYLNIFTRDNTNDGGGWDIRVTHILQGAHYGYPSKYINYPEETMPPLGQYGGGSGCGGMYFFDNRWPAKYASAALTCDWGTSRVYAHQGEAVGATFAPSQEVFLELPRPTDIDVDGSGRMYVSSWKNGGFNFSDPNVGFVAQVVPQGFVAKPFPDVTKLSDDDLIKWLATGNSVPALAVQREILRRGASGSLPSKLQTLIAQDAAPLAGRVAAIFTYKQLLGHTANDFLTKQARTNSSIRRYAMRALTDRLNQLDQVDQSLFVSGLSDSDAAVQAQALISLTQLARAGKLADRAAIAALVLPLAVVRDPDGNARTTPVAHQLADPARVVPHLATVALREMKAGSECVQALKSEYRTRRTCTS